MNRFPLVLLSITSFALAQDGVYRIGGRVSAPKPIFKAEPEYSEEARRAEVNTYVLFQLVVRSDGTTSDAKVLRGGGFGLDEKAIETVKTWWF